MSERFSFIGGLYDQNRCVAIASVKLMDGYSRMDNVKTHAAFRGRYFGTRLMRYVVSYHAQVSKNYLYLFAKNPVAIRMYRNVGFQELLIDKTIWSAYQT